MKWRELTVVRRTEPAFQIVQRWSWSRIAKESSPWIHRRITWINALTWFFVRPALRATSANSNSERVPNGFHGLLVLDWGFLGICRAWYVLKELMSGSRFVSGWYSILISPIEGPLWELSLSTPWALHLCYVFKCILWFGIVIHTSSKGIVVERSVGGHVNVVISEIRLW